MGRNLVICIDGTNNESGPENTNIVRVVEVVSRQPAPQLVYYDPGAGTLPEPGLLTRAGKKISQWIDLAFATSLTRDVEESYTYLMETWEPGDSVFLFGFSRGAYTARVLAGMLHHLGLLPRGSGNLLPYAMRLYKSVRGKAQRNYWKLCNQFRRTFARPVAGSSVKRFRVHFLGVWDMIQIDLEDPDVVDKIKNAIAGNAWAVNLDAIREARRRVLNEHQILAQLARYIHGHEGEGECARHMPVRNTVYRTPTTRKGRILRRLLEILPHPLKLPVGRALSRSEKSDAGV